LYVAVTAAKLGVTVSVRVEVGGEMVGAAVSGMGDGVTLGALSVA
jgi:hypothetical protein